MEREEAINIVRNICQTDAEKKALQTLIPELAESEDERMVRKLESFLSAYGTDYFSNDECREIEVWLEKQKENPKSAVSIPSDCVSDAKWANRVLTNAIVALGNSVDYNRSEPLIYSKEIDDLKRLREEIEKQQEQKPSEYLDEHKVYAIITKLHNLACSQLIPINSDELKKIDEISRDVRALLDYDYPIKQEPAESISQLTVQGKGVCKICPRCGERMIRDDSKVYTSMPPQYGYECPKCGEVKFDTVMYDNPEMEEQKPNTFYVPYNPDDYEVVMEGNATSLKRKEQKPAELPKSEDHGIDGLYAAIDILQKTLGEVDGYQTDDGILEHKCAISAVKELYEQKPAEWSEDYRAEDIQTRFAFYTYKDVPSVLYLSNVFVEEASRNRGFGTRILKAAEKVAEAIGATKIFLKVKQDSPANAWYRKNGYGYIAFEDGYDWLEKNLEYMKPNKQEWSEVELEFRGEKVTVKRPFYRDDKGRGYSTTEQDEDVAWYALRAWCEKKGISSYNLYPREEWSEEDESCLENALWCVVETRHFVAKDACDLDACRSAERWLNSLKPSDNS